VTDLSQPNAVQARLQSIEEDLAVRQNAYERAARAWFTAQREIVRVRAVKLLSSEATSVTEKKADADLAAYDVEGASAEAEYEALRAAVKVLELRATIGMSILKSQGRF
jgi:hypothetical protein